MRETITLTVALVAGTALAAPPAHAVARPEVLRMSPALRHQLGSLFDRRHNPGNYKQLVVRKRNAHYGRAGGKYYAVVAIWYKDSPVKDTDAGTAFVKRAGGSWRIRMADGAYDPCTRPAPKRLMRAWGMPVEKC